MTTYSTAIIGWNEKEMKYLDRKTQMLVTLYGMFHKKNVVDHLSLKRAEGEKCIRL